MGWNNKKVITLLDSEIETSDDYVKTERLSLKMSYELLIDLIYKPPFNEIQKKIAPSMTFTWNDLIY